jgi:hypothetical protein
MLRIKFMFACEETYKNRYLSNPEALMIHPTSEAEIILNPEATLFQLHTRSFAKKLLGHLFQELARFQRGWQIQEHNSGIQSFTSHEGAPWLEQEARNWPTDKP